MVVWGRGAERQGFLLHLLPGSTPWIPTLYPVQLRAAASRSACPWSDGRWPVLQAEGWVLPSWFQLGTRKLARGIFSPGFWRSQRSFIVGGTGHSRTQLANAGLLGCRADRLRAGSGVRGEKGQMWPCPSLGLGSGECQRQSGPLSSECHAQDVSVGLKAPTGIGGQAWEKTCCLPR